jgi:hypothetical protein
VDIRLVGDNTMVLNRRRQRRIWVGNVRKGNIHVGEQFIDGCGGGTGSAGEARAIRVLIHEATHKFAQTRDEAYFKLDGYIAGKTFWGDAVQDTEKLLNNADSISLFCLLMAGLTDTWNKTKPWSLFNEG